MQTKTRTETNRENARKSTGPRTPEGKRRSALNATRHGLTSQVIVLPQEDLTAYQTFARAIVADLSPAGALEIQLAQSIADISWQLNRARALENNLHTLAAIDNADSIGTEHPQVHSALTVAGGFRNQHPALANLSAHQHRLARQFERAYAQLHQIQARRGPNSGRAHTLNEPTQLHSNQSDTNENGFVSENFKSASARASGATVETAKKEAA